MPKKWDPENPQDSVEKNLPPPPYSQLNFTTPQYPLGPSAPSVYTTASAWGQPAGAGLPPPGYPQGQPTGAGLPPPGYPQAQPAGAGLPPPGYPQGQPAGAGLPPPGYPQGQPAAVGLPPPDYPKGQPAGVGHPQGQPDVVSQHYNGVYNQPAAVDPDYVIINGVRQKRVKGVDAAARRRMTIILVIIFVLLKAALGIYYYLYVFGSH